MHLTSSCKLVLKLKANNCKLVVLDPWVAILADARIIRSCRADESKFLKSSKFGLSTRRPTCQQHHRQLTCLKHALAGIGAGRTSSQADPKKTLNKPE